ncbi:MAG: phage portal protein [Mycoplasmoidaceae bacterium]|nr:phage portal protein [Mycoplasmoidaceae bacterium]
MARRSMLKSMFGKEETSTKSLQKFKMVNSYDSTFTPWDGNIYNSDIVRSCLRPKATAVGKLHPVHVRNNGDDIVLNPNPNIKYLLRFPNKYMNMQKLLEKMMNQRELTNNAFAIILKDKFQKPISIFPVPTNKTEMFEDSKGDLYIKFYFSVGKPMVVMYDDVIHLRKDYNNHEFYGEDGYNALKNVMKVIDTTDKGIVSAIKNSNIIKWLMKFKSVLREDDKKQAMDSFAENYLSIEKSNGNSIASVDPRYDIEQIKDNSYVPENSTIGNYETRLKNYFGVNDSIISNKFNEDEWNAFYESEIESVAKELSDQFTFKIFTKHEIECGNEIVFEASSLEFASMSNKLNLKEMVDRKSMTPNEWRRIMNLSSVDGGDVLLRRLDTGESKTLSEEEKNNGKE